MITCIYSVKVSRINVKYHNDKWYVNLTPEIQEAEAVEIINKVGIDVGLLTFAALSDGTKIDNPKYFHKSEKKLARLQRQLSRKKKGSNNRGKARAKVTRLHDKIANQRKDFLHKASYGIVKKYDFVAVEDLLVKNMVKCDCQENLSRRLEQTSINLPTCSLEMVLCDCKKKSEPRGMKGASPVRAIIYLPNTCFNCIIFLCSLTISMGLQQINGALCKTDSERGWCFHIMYNHLRVILLIVYQTAS